MSFQGWPLLTCPKSNFYQSCSLSVKFTKWKCRIHGSSWMRMSLILFSNIWRKKPSMFWATHEKFTKKKFTSMWYISCALFLMAWYRTKRCKKNCFFSLLLDLINFSTAETELVHFIGRFTVNSRVKKNVVCVFFLVVSTKRPLLQIYYIVK